MGIDMYLEQSQLQSSECSDHVSISGGGLSRLAISHPKVFRG